MSVDLTKIEFIGASTSNYTKNRSGKSISYIVIHYTAGNNDTARANAKYFQTFREASAHYFVDSKEIIQTVADEYAAWHCGTQYGYKHKECRNANSIGIEICSHKDSKGNYYFDDEAVARAADLTASLMRKYNIPIENVIRHYDVTGKVCPAPFVKNESDWKSYLRLCNGLLSPTTDYYIGIVQSRVKKKLEDKTIKYISDYKYADELWKRLAEME